MSRESVVVIVFIGGGRAGREDIQTLDGRSVRSLTLFSCLAAFACSSLVWILPWPLAQGKIVDKRENAGDNFIGPPSPFLGFIPLS